MNLPVTLFAMLKGGTRKSTSAMLTAWSLAEGGDEVLLIDADAGTQGVTDWTTRVYATGAEPPFHVAQWTHRLGLLVPFVREQAARTGATRVLIDIGGEAPEVLAQAARIATRVVTPVGPEQGELGRLQPTRQVIAEAGGAPMSVLLTRVPVAGRGIARQVRETLEADRYHVLRTEVPHNRELYAHPWGTVPTSLGAYAYLADELRKMER